MHLSYLLDPLFLVKTLGTAGVIAIIFAESGLFFGFFFPGDSLLFTAALLAAEGYLPLWPLLIGCALAAIAGDSVGYAFGVKAGHKLFIREDSLFFRRSFVERTQTFYQKHGKKTVVLARFIPIVRTFAPILAGVGKMNYSVFLSYNVAGGLIWSVGNITLGYVLGRTIPNIDKYATPIIIVIIAISMLPGLFEYARSRRTNRSGADNNPR